MAGLPWWGWIILAGTLAVAELHVPGSYLVWIALGAALTGAIDAALVTSLTGQTGTFAIASAVSCGLGYFVYRQFDQWRRREPAPLNERGNALLGARGIVCEAFLNGHGKVRLGDSVWLADGSDLPHGTLVVVSGVRGTRLIVQPAAPVVATEPPAAHVS